MSLCSRFGGSCPNCVPMAGLIWRGPALEHWNPETLWNTGTLELQHWNTGPLEHWNTGALEHWDTGALEHWNSGLVLKKEPRKTSEFEGSIRNRFLRVRRLQMACGTTTISTASTLSAMLPRGGLYAFDSLRGYTLGCC